MNNAHSYTRSKLWLYIPLWIFFAYLFILILQQSTSATPNFIVAGMSFIDFGVHEASHLVFAFLPSILVASAGSIGEIAFTILIVIAAFKAHSYFAMIFGALWTMLAMNSVGRYIADARAQILPLIGPTPDALHDWHFILGQLGWLQYDMIIGEFVRGAGIAIGAIALGIGLWMLIRMAMTSDSLPTPLKNEKNLYTN